MPIEKQNWEERFDLIPHGGALSSRGDYLSVINAKNFIKNLLLERDKELWQKMEEKKGDGHIMDDVYCVECFKRMPNSHDYKWNEAIENCQSLLDIDEK